MVIVAIMATLAVLSVSGGLGDRPTKEEVRRLNALLHIASEEAVLFNRSLGLKFNEAGYAFYRLEEVPIENEEDSLTATNPFLPQGNSQQVAQPQTEKRWMLIEGDDFLKERELPDGVELELSVDGAAVTVEEPSLDILDESIERVKPNLFITPDGEIYPSFRIEISEAQAGRDAPSYLLEVNNKGELEWREREL